MAGTVSAPAQAAPPPPGYPSNEVMGYGQGSAANYPIRRGFYDADANQGFGLDKAWWKHGIYSVGAISWAMGGTERWWEGTDFLTRVYANKITCDSWGCQVEASQPVKTVAGTQSVTTYYSQPVYGQLGLKTIYCEGYIVCPWWVTGAMDGTLKRSATDTESAGNKVQPSSSDSLYISYAPLAVGSSVEKADVDNQQKDIKQADLAAAK